MTDDTNTEAGLTREGLLPCPFCGGEPEITQKGTARQSMQIACMTCGARTDTGDVFGLTRPRNYHWNRRDQITQLQAQLAAKDVWIKDRESEVQREQVGKVRKFVKVCHCECNNYSKWPSCHVRPSTRTHQRRYLKGGLMIPARDISECNRIVDDFDTAFEAVTAEPIKKCMCCQRFYFKRGVASVYVEPQHGVATHGICVRCNIEYRAKHGLPAPK